MTDKEIRFTPVNLELRQEDGRNLPTIYGYSAVFNALSDNLGGFRERLAPTAFDRTLQERGESIKAFHNHNPDIVIGSTRKGTLELSTDQHGLAHRIAPPDNAWGRPVVDAIERGDIEGMSFGFALGNPGAESWSDGEDGLQVRDVAEVKLYEVSTVSAWPAYPQTSVGVRTLAKAVEVEDAEMRSALAALMDPSSTLTSEQHELLMRAVNARTDTPYIAPDVAGLMARRLRMAQKMGLDESESNWSPGNVTARNADKATAPETTQGSDEEPVSEKEEA